MSADEDFSLSDLHDIIWDAVVKEDTTNYPVSIDAAVNIAVESTFEYVVEWLHERGNPSLAHLLEELRNNESQD